MRMHNARGGCLLGLTRERVTAAPGKRQALSYLVIVALLLAGSVLALVPRTRGFLARLGTIEPGEARVEWTLSNRAGVQRLRAQVGLAMEPDHALAVRVGFDRQLGAGRDGAGRGAGTRRQPARRRGLHRPYDGTRGHARDRDRRQHGDLQCGGRDAPPATALSRA